MFHDAIIITIGLVLVVVYNIYACSKFRTPQVTILMRKTLLLMVFIITRGVANVFLGVVYRFYIDSFLYSVVYALTYLPFSLLTIPLGYLIYLFANNSNQGCCHCRCVTVQDNPEKQPLVDPKTTETPAVVSAPSNTVPLTLENTGIGNTTEICNNAQKQVLVEIDNSLSFCFPLCCYPNQHLHCNCFKQQVTETRPVIKGHSNIIPTNRPSTRVSGPSTTVPPTLIHTGIGHASTDAGD